MSSTPTIRFGIAGAAGRTGRQFIDLIGRAAHAALAGVADIQREECRSLAKKCGAKYYGSHTRLIESGDVDAVVACVPPSRRPKIVEEAVAAGTPVLVPLPIASSAGEAEAAIRAAAEASAPVAAAAAYRFMRHAQRAGEVVRAKELGRVHTVISTTRGPVEGTWLDRGGGALMGPAAYVFDLLTWLFGVPARVCATVWPGPDTDEVEQSVSAVLDYGDGRHALVHCGPPAWPLGDRLEAMGDLGRMVVDERASLHVFGSAPHTHPPADEEGQDVEAGLVTAVEDFADAVMHAHAPRVSIEEAAKSLEVANAISLAGRTEAAVPLPLDRDAYASMLRQLRKAERAAVP